MYMFFVISMGLLLAGLSFLFIMVYNDSKKVSLTYTVATDLIGSFFIGTSHTEELPSITHAQKKIKELMNDKYIISFEIKDRKGKLL